MVIFNIMLSDDSLKLVSTQEIVNNPLSSNRRHLSCDVSLGIKR